MAAALRQDDEEIQALEMKLGVSKQSKHTTSKNTPTNRSKLHKEYAKLEGYGQDFGEFLEPLDNVIDSIL
jgi:nucleolar MIF4G domain-containing protein 1